MSSNIPSSLSVSSSNSTESTSTMNDSPPESENSLPSTELSGNSIAPQATTKFQPGQSGNPLGRPKGSKNQITLLKLSLEQALREQAAPQMRAVLDKAMEMAMKGHPGMIKLLMELHVSKTSDKDDTRGADDKITININALPQRVSVEGSIASENPAKIEAEPKEPPIEAEFHQIKETQ